MKKLALVVVALSVFAFAAHAVERQSFGPLSPSARPYERQYIWPEGRMPDAQPGAVAEKSAVVSAKGFDRSKHTKPFIDWYAPDPSNRTDLCVMTVSGGGFWHCCDAARLQPAIDRLVAAGATINGLCVLHEEPDLVAWYEREVIGGPGAFAQPCDGYAGFADAMRRKLLREALVA